MDSNRAELSQKLRQWKARKEELESFKAKKLATKPKWGSTSRGSPDKTLSVTSSHRSTRLSLSSTCSTNTTPQKSFLAKTPSITPSRISAAHPQNYYNEQLEAAQSFSAAGLFIKAEAMYQMLWASPYSEQATHDSTFWDCWFQASTGGTHSASAPPTPTKREPRTPLRTPLAPISLSELPTNSRENVANSLASTSFGAKTSSKIQPTQSEALGAVKASFFSPRKNLSATAKFRAPTLGTPRTMAAKRAELLGLKPTASQKTFGSYTPIADRLRRELDKIDENEGNKCDDDNIQTLHLDNDENVKESTLPYSVQIKPEKQQQTQSQLLSQTKSEEKLVQRHQSQRCVLPDGVLVSQTPEKSAAPSSITPKAIKSLELVENDENISPFAMLNISASTSSSSSNLQDSSLPIIHLTSTSATTSSMISILSSVSTLRTRSNNEVNICSTRKSPTSQIPSLEFLQPTDKSEEVSSHNENRSNDNDKMLSIKNLHSPATNTMLDETYTCIRYTNDVNDIPSPLLSPEKMNLTHDITLLSPLKEETSFDEKHEPIDTSKSSPLLLSLQLNEPASISVKSKNIRRRSIVPSPCLSPISMSELSFDLPPSVQTRKDASVIHTLFMPTFSTEEQLNGEIALEAVRVKNLRKSTKNEISIFTSSPDLILSPVRRSTRRKSVQTPEEIRSLLEKTNYMFSPNPDLQVKSTAKRLRPSRLETVKEESQLAMGDLSELLSDEPKPQIGESPARRSARVSSRLNAPAEPSSQLQNCRRVDTPRPPSRMQPKASTRASRSR